MTTPRHDMTPIVDLSYEKGTGPVHVRRLIYVDLLPTCTAHVLRVRNIPAWLDLAQSGKYRQAWEALVCATTQCRRCTADSAIAHANACNRAELDAAVSIHAVERFLGDVAAQEVDLSRSRRH